MTDDKNEITHTVRITVPSWAWDKAAAGLRDLRALHRELPQRDQVGLARLAAAEQASMDRLMDGLIERGLVR